MYDPYYVLLIGSSVLAVYATGSLVARLVTLVRSWRALTSPDRKRRAFVSTYVATIAAGLWWALFWDEHPMSLGFDHHEVVTVMIGVTSCLGAFYIHVGGAKLLAKLWFRTHKPEGRTQLWRDGAWRDYETGMSI